MKCPKCEGQGELYPEPSLSDPGPAPIVCPICNGTGKVKK